MLLIESSYSISTQVDAVQISSASTSGVYLKCLNITVLFLDFYPYIIDIFSVRMNEKAGQQGEHTGDGKDAVLLKK